MSSITGKPPSLKLPPHIDTARDLLLEQLGRLLTVEETLAKVALPQLVVELDDEQLKDAISSHLAQTRRHSGRLKEAFLALGELPSGRPALGLDGLKTEHGASSSDLAPSLRPFYACTAAMGVEHYEINEYETAIRLAEAAGERDVTHLLYDNLREEIEALQKLGAEADRLGSQLD